MSSISRNWPSFNSFWCVQTKTALYKGQIRGQILQKSGLYGIVYVWYIFISVWYISISPFLWRLSSNTIRFDENLSIMFFSHMLMFFLGIFLFGLKLPERLAPGHFDSLGHSHNWMHVFTALGVFMTQYLFMYAISTRDDLPGHKITAWDTFGFLFVCIVSNITIVVVVVFRRFHIRIRQKEL